MQKCQLSQRKNADNVTYLQRALGSHSDDASAVKRGKQIKKNVEYGSLA